MHDKGNLTNKIKNLQRRTGSESTGGPDVITIALKMEKGGTRIREKEERKSL